MTLRLHDWDWVTIDPDHDTLHHPSLSDAAADQLMEDGYFDDGVRTTCGKRTFRADIPGVFARLGSSRCAACCDYLGYPHGVGSPKNDPHIRGMLGLPEDADR